MSFSGVSERVEKRVEDHCIHPLLFLCVLSILLVIPCLGTAQSTQQGLRLRLSPQDGTSIDVRRARTVSLYVGEDEPVSPFLPAGPFKATWKGALTFDGFGIDVTLSARGRGRLKVKVNGENAFDGTLNGRERVRGSTVGVTNGKNDLKVKYTSPQDGPAWVRLYWESEKFYPEPLPVNQLVHRTTDRMKAHRKRRTGRNLFLNHRCIRCHRDEKGTERKHAPPERDMDAPDLSASGTKFRTDWMADWVADPHKYRDDTAMPAVLTGSDESVRRQSRDVAAYLATCTDESASGPDVELSADAQETGRRHFRSLGCVSCHSVGGEATGDGSSFDRVSLAHVAEKWKPGPLAAYLKDPRDHYRWSRMPDFRLDSEKASALAAYLIGKTKEKGQKQENHGKTGRVKRGKKLMVENGCYRCHQGKDGSSYQAPGLSSLFADDEEQDGNGCLAPSAEARGNAPDFGFDEKQREALLAFLSADHRSSLSRHVPAEFAARQVERLRCTSCHRRDGNESVWSRLPDERTDVELDKERTRGVKQLRPPLTWVGDMLQYDWMNRVISGTLEEKPRPWLVARMPGYGVYGSHMAEGLASQHGFPAKRINYPESSHERAKAGKKIVTQLNCYSCHGAGDREPNTFEVAGVNFVKSGRRLHRNFAIRWVLKPGRVRQGTGMPAFFQWGEPSPLSGILGGDVRKQMDAIWQYLRNAEELESESE